MSDLVDGQTFAQIEREGAKGAILGSLMSQSGWPLPRRSIPSSVRGIDVGPQRFTEVVLNAWSVRRGGVERRQPRIPGARKWVAPSAPGQTIFLNTLGVAQYRAGRHAEAITTWSEAWPPGLARAMLTTSSSSP